MKSDLVDVNDTRKQLRIEIPSNAVDEQIDRVARDYGRKARIPGFRPGKAPARVIKARFRDQILHDVAHELIPRAVDDAVREIGIEPLDTPAIQDVNIEQGQALTFTASFDTVPPFELGDYGALSLRRPPTLVGDEAVDSAMQRLRTRAARYEPIEGRGVIDGDTATLDLTRGTDHHGDVTVELGSASNPPGFDAQLLGLEPGATKTFTIHYPADHAVSELADTDVAYTVGVKDIKRKILPELDDEFAKDLGEFDTLDALRARVRVDLEHEAQHHAQHALRDKLMQQLAAWLPFEVPASLVERELDRRIEDFAQRLVDQGIDPRKAGIDWAGFRDSQRPAARDAVAAALVLEEVARREHVEVTDQDVEREVGRHAERTGRTPAATRAALERENGLSRVRGALRREKTIDLVMGRATIASE